jgi:hypothetical protein
MLALRMNAGNRDDHVPEGSRSSNPLFKKRFYDFIEAYFKLHCDGIIAYLCIIRFVRTLSLNPA